jgi:hypothetical protein
MQQITTRRRAFVIHAKRKVPFGYTSGQALHAPVASRLERLDWMTTSLFPLIASLTGTLKLHPIAPHRAFAGSAGILYILSVKFSGEATT